MSKPYWEALRSSLEPSGWSIACGMERNRSDTQPCLGSDVATQHLTILADLTSLEKGRAGQLLCYHNEAYSWMYSTLKTAHLFCSTVRHRSSENSLCLPLTMETSQVVERPTEHVSSAQAHSLKSTAKKQSKWSPDEDARIIELRGKGTTWEDISKQLLGRSATSCRLHYQNYLERRSGWDEDRKNRLARLYERYRADMWKKIAEEMTLPWRAAEAMHWQIGEQEMARRAGVVPFSLSNNQSLPPSTLPPSHIRHSAAPRIRGESLSRAGPPRLPSLDELAAGVPANFQLGIRPMARPHNSNDSRY